jgi:fatty acid desaturase
MEQELKYLLRESRKLEVSKVNRTIHNFVNLGVFLCVSSLFLGLCHFSTLSNYVLFLSPVIFGIIFFAYFILVVHEGSHLMFLVVKNTRTKRYLNRVFSYPIAALSFQDYVEDWETGHLEHHRNPIVGDKRPDPQNCPEFIHDKRDLLKEIFKILTRPGYAFFKQNSCVKMDKKFLCKRVCLGLLAWGSLLLINITFFKWWLIVPQVLSANITMILNLIKVSMEHGGNRRLQKDVFLRSKSSLFLGDKILMPMNIALHFEHHLNMHVPWYQLKRFYKITKKSSSEELLSLVH